MDAERARALLLKLPHVTETMQWGENLVFWVGDKTCGGKMFVLVPLDGGGPVVSFAAGAESAAELLEREHFRPAPYLARAHWVAADRWDAVPLGEWKALFCAAHELVYSKLPPKTKRLLAGTATSDLPAAEKKAREAQPKVGRVATRR